MFPSSIFLCAVLNFAAVGTENIASSLYDQEETHKCLLPPYPEHGTYTVSNYPFATPGKRYDSVKLDIFCDTGYLNNNSITSVLCVKGYWSASMPTCVLDMRGFCTLSTEDRKVGYYCLSFQGTLKKPRECDSMVPSGTIVKPVCRFPDYFSRRVLPAMHCKDGIWDYSPMCELTCGQTTNHRQLEDTSSDYLELPWHAVIYRKELETYEEFCGGSLLTASKIISTAYCFSNFEGIPRMSDFVVTVNKIYRKYNDTRDKMSQDSEVADIITPSNYRGYETYYKDNIAIVVVKTPFFLHVSVRPICLNFDKNLDSTQLTDGKSSKIVRWGWSEVDEVYEVLSATDFLYIKNEECENKLWFDERPYLTKDKFCVTYDTWLVTQNSGSGLVFLEPTSQRYYLQGVASDYLRSADGRMQIVMYTSIQKHEEFIKEHL